MEDKANSTEQNAQFSAPLAESTDDDIEKCPSYTKVLRFTFVAKPFLTQVAPLQILPSAVR